MHELTMAELEAETVALLPAREALGLLKFDVVDIDATNTAAALNLFTEDSVAVANAQQYIAACQH